VFSPEHQILHPDVAMPHLDTRNPSPSFDTVRIISEPAALGPASRFAIMRAFLAFCVVDLVLMTRGYMMVRRWLSRLHVHQEAGAVATVDVERTLAAVEHAAVYYPRETMCLHRSAVATWLLRRDAVPAYLVIGIRHTPFYAHAWVEIDGKVVNDRSSVQQQYPEMERV
jgi:hypothetical protein